MSVSESCPQECLQGSPYSDFPRCYRLLKEASSGTSHKSVSFLQGNGHSAGWENSPHCSLLWKGTN